MSEENKLYDVHLQPVVRVKMCGISAPNGYEAVVAAKRTFELNDVESLIFNKTFAASESDEEDALRDGAVSHVEFDDEYAGATVELHGIPAEFKEPEIYHYDRDEDDFEADSVRTRKAEKEGPLYARGLVAQIAEALSESVHAVLRSPDLHRLADAAALRRLGKAVDLAVDLNLIAPQEAIAEGVQRATEPFSIERCYERAGPTVLKTVGYRVVSNALPGGGLGAKSFPLLCCRTEAFEEVKQAVVQANRLIRENQCNMDLDILLKSSQLQILRESGLLFGPTFFHHDLPTAAVSLKEAEPEYRGSAAQGRRGPHQVWPPTEEAASSSRADL